MKVRLFYAQGTPVPIPNTEVKLRSADNTWRETAREDRSRRTRREAIAILRKGKLIENRIKEEHEQVK